MILGLRVTVSGLFAVSALFAFSETPPGESAFPGDNGLIAFSTTRDGNGEIYQMAADGSDPTNLTNTDNESESNPAWSADGQRLAFRSEAHLTVMNADGSGRMDITDDPPNGSDSNPAWSPDGTQVVFESSRLDNSEIFAVNADGNGEVNLTNDESEDHRPSWSPDGMKIAFDSNRIAGNRQIFVMNADGSDPIRISNSDSTDSGPDWSPDGTKIAFSRVDDIWIMNADGSDQVQLTDDPDFDSQPAWSPDGSMIAFHRSVGGGFLDTEIFVINANGTNETRLTNMAGWRNLSAGWQPIPPPGIAMLWGDDDCDGGVGATDGLKNLQDVAGLPYGQTEPCFPIGDPVGVGIAGFGQLIWGDVDCDGDVDSTDALSLLRWVAALPVSQEPNCPEIGAQVLVEA